VQGQSVKITTGNAAVAAIDTGTTLIGGPTADVNAIWAAVPGSAAVVNQEGFFSFRELQFSPPPFKKFVIPNVPHPRRSLFYLS